MMTTTTHERMRAKISFIPRHIVSILMRAAAWRRPARTLRWCAGSLQAQA
jgi:hypothetical protein